MFCAVVPTIEPEPWGAAGRRPYTDGLGLEELGVKLDDRRRIQVDKHFKSRRGELLAYKMPRFCDCLRDASLVLRVRT